MAVSGASEHLLTFQGCEHPPRTNSARLGNVEGPLALLPPPWGNSLLFEGGRLLFGRLSFFGLTILISLAARFPAWRSPSAICRRNESLVSIASQKPWFSLHSSMVAKTSHEEGHDGAIADFNHAIQLSPQFVQAYINLGSAKANSGDLDEAITDFNQAVRLDPDPVVPH